MAQLAMSQEGTLKLTMLRLEEIELKLRTAVRDGGEG